MAAKKQEPIKIITHVAEEFFSDIGVEAEISVTKAEGEEESYIISLTGPDLGALIGYHGETLNALQLILSLIVSHQLDHWVRLTLNAGDWRERRGESLEAMALHAISKVVATGTEVEMPPMSPSDRRIIHLALKDHPEVTSESSGEGNFRRVVIRPS
jgi:spoIIIJ-associated protein